MHSQAVTTDESNPMNFTENQQGNVILEKLRKQREDGKFCDVVLHVQDQKFHLHRNILASFSPLFESLLRPHRVVHEEFSITSQSPETFQSFVNYMYTGSVVISKRNVCDLLKLAYRLGVTKLKDYCAEYLERDLDLTNCLAVRDAAQSCDLSNLFRHTNTFVMNNIETVLNGAELLAQDASKLESFLSDKYFGLGQSQILQAVLTWTRQDVENRQNHIHTLIKLVNFSELNIQYVNEMFDAETLFVNSEVCFYFTLKHILACGIVLEKYHVSLNALEQKYGQVQISEDKIKEPIETNIKLKIQKKKRKRMLRGNPLARLAALRMALQLRKRKSGKLRKQQKTDCLQQTRDENSLQCHLCEHRASDTTALEHHLSAVHSRDVTYKCGICGFVCQWNNLYLQHVRGHFPGPPFKCDSCEFASDKINEVLTHRSVHIDDKTHRCLQCGFRSRSQSSLLAHTKCHTNGAADKNNSNADTRSYVCDFCGFSSKYLSHLIAHKRIHTGDIYRCSYPHCKFTAGKKSQLGSHTKSHQGSRPHCCTICGRGFLEKSHLVRHERIHLEEKPFKCHECDYASSRRDKLKEHQARHHGDLASAKVPYKARSHKKQDSYHQNVDSRQQTPSNNGELHDVLVNNNPQPSMSAYAFPTNELHVHHPTAGTLDFHQQHILGSSANARVKEHRNGAVHQPTAAAVTAAMILDPRFHHGTTSAYGTPVSMPASMTGQQVVQATPAHQVSDYPTALMSLF